MSGAKRPAGAGGAARPLWVAPMAHSISGHGPTRSSNDALAVHSRVHAMASPAGATISHGDACGFITLGSTFTVPIPARFHSEFSFSEPRVAVGGRPGLTERAEGTSVSCSCRQLLGIVHASSSGGTTMISNISNNFHSKSLFSQLSSLGGRGASPTHLKKGRAHPIGRAESADVGREGAQARA